MAVKSTEVETSPIRLSRGPLLYLNYPKNYRLLAYDYLLHGKKIIEYEPVFNIYELRVIEDYQGSVPTLLNQAKKQTTSKARRKINEVALLKAYRNLFLNKASEDFQKAVKVVWGEPDKELFSSLLHEA